MISIGIKQFLNEELKKRNLTKKQLSVDSGTTYSTVCDLVGGYKSNPELKTVFKLAKYFDVSIDQVLGRDPSYYSNTTTFISISSEQININLKLFIRQKLAEHKISANKLGRLVGFSIMAISAFVSENASKQSLGSAIVTGLADYFNISIDEMIGRVQSAKDKKIGANSKEEVNNSQLSEKV